MSRAYLACKNTYKTHKLLWNCLDSFSFTFLTYGRFKKIKVSFTYQLKFLQNFMFLFINSIIFFVFYASYLYSSCSIFYFFYFLASQSDLLKIFLILRDRLPSKYLKYWFKDRAFAVLCFTLQVKIQDENLLIIIDKCFLCYYLRKDYSNICIWIDLFYF